MDAEDLAAFTTAVRQAAQRHGGDFDKGLEEIGWREALAEDSSAARAVFAVQGELNLSSSALDDVLLRAIGRVPDPQTAVLVSPCRHGTRRLTAAAQVLVVHGELAVEVPRTALVLRTSNGLDPTGEWVEVAGALEAASLGRGTSVAAEAAVAAGRLALATELAAASRSMLELAREHAMTRIQFGRPIASFQAVRHRLADSLVAVAAAEAAVDAGWEETTPYPAAMAKAIAGRSARTVARHAQQVLAGMGFTAEHRFHRYLRRTLVLDQLLGSAAEISTAMGDAAITSREISPMLAL